MDKDKIRKMYFNWMVDLVHDKKILGTKKYTKLLSRLAETNFVYTNRMDENRESDGIDLRYSRFGWEYEINSYEIDQCFNPDHCSMLEMLIALAIRCEENFMQNNDHGNRTAKWFWKMIGTLGLGEMDDISYNEEETDRILARFLNHEYEPDGRGGLFYIPDSAVDLRTVEIWCQLCWFLDGYLELT